MSGKSDGRGQADRLTIEFIDGLYSYAMVLARNRAEAEDLVQETYLRAMQAKGNPGPGGNIKGWMFTILRNIWLNKLRRVRNAPQMVEIEGENGAAEKVVEPSGNADDLYIRRAEAEQVRAAIEELPVKFREIILLREYEDLSYQEIAAVLGCSIGTVMSRLARARARLRTLYFAILKRPELSAVRDATSKIPMTQREQRKRDPLIHKRQAQFGEQFRVSRVAAQIFH
jgi:RNA polymerase sigma-70 factor, ECF subfamily